jgi:hypothetical protein
VPKHIAVSLMLRGVSVDGDLEWHQNMCSISGVFKISEKHVHIDDHYSGAILLILNTPIMIFRLLGLFFSHILHHEIWSSRSLAVSNRLYWRSFSLEYASQEEFNRAARESDHGLVLSPEWGNSGKLGNCMVVSLTLLSRRVVRHSNSSVTQEE